MEVHESSESRDDEPLELIDDELLDTEDSPESEDDELLTVPVLVVPVDAVSVGATVSVLAVPVLVDAAVSVLAVAVDAELVDASVPVLDVAVDVDDNELLVDPEALEAAAVPPKILLL